MVKKTLKYFLDNKNFSRIPQKRKAQESLLKVVDDQIVMGYNTSDKNESDEIVTSFTYMKKKGNKKKWRKEENELFYEALECCGCDFSMMNALFPDRTRSNLKDKYKKESKKNPQMVEDALAEFKKFDIEKFNRLKRMQK